MEREKIKKLLLKLNFNINSKGFDYWIQAIHLYTTFEKIGMMELYEQLAFEFMTTKTRIERAMRNAKETAIENIKTYFEYNNKITNQAILNLIRIKEMK